MKKGMKFLMAAILLLSAEGYISAQCAYSSGSTYFNFTLNDYNSPPSTGSTGGSISIERILPINSSDPVSTYKWVSIYTVYNDNTEYSSEASDNGGNNTLTAEFSYNYDNFDYISYSWEVWYGSSNLSQLKNCVWFTNSYALKEGISLNDVPGRLKISNKAGNSPKFLFSGFDSNAQAARHMRNRIANNAGLLLFKYY